MSLQYYLKWFYNRIRGITLIDKSDPMYDKPNISLLDKSKYHEMMTNGTCIDNDTGLLLYKRFFEDKQSKEDYNYVKTMSFDMADAPAWHCQYMTGLIFKAAVTWELDDIFLKLVEGLENFMNASGKSVLCRSYIKHDSDERLEWMKTRGEAEAKDELDQGWWQKGEDGFWFRGQCAPGHYQAFWTLFCVIGGLQRDGYIKINQELCSRLSNIFCRVYRTINDYGKGDIIGVDGKVTGFGNTDVYYVNPQFALWHLTRHLAATFWDPIYKDKARSIYLEKLANYESAFKAYDIFVPVLKHIALNQRPLKANDIHWQHFAWLGLIIGEKNREFHKEVRNGFKRLYDLHDPFNIHNYIIQKVGRNLKDSIAHKYFLNAMDWYPLDKFVYEQPEIIETTKFQPLENRRITSSYAKSDPCKKVVDVSNGRSNMLNCGFDYVFYYWMARYFKLIKE